MDAGIERHTSVAPLTQRSGGPQFCRPLTYRTGPESGTEVGHAFGSCGGVAERLKAPDL